MAQRLPIIPRVTPIWIEPIGQFKYTQETIHRYLSEVRNIVKPGLGKLLPDVIYLTYKSITSAAFNAIVHPGQQSQWVKILEDQATYQGKFSKMQVAYIDLNPPPLFWDYKCAKCRWFNAPYFCKVVEGKISRDGWCAIWSPPNDYKRFTWPKELLSGDW